jgi:putative ABC transport system permease protein
VIGKALTVTLVGAGFGLLFSLASTHLLRGFLYGLSPVDPKTYVSVVLLWMVVALIASCVPAYPRDQGGPAVALREE